MWPFQNTTIENIKYITSRKILPQYLRDKFNVMPEAIQTSQESTEQIPSLQQILDDENKLAYTNIEGSEFVLLEERVKQKLNSLNRRVHLEDLVTL